ncbi:hypothetical protein FGADI_5887 [Fusarium gaditjirri]|uniref:Uncharacterized protein n=1 Tax=Fusarium gaditjirri TaxID=282569 RepID=A0A8H4WXM4_9HYPO|nr:hypothetical protein FGADI_5887 [Fusarium gaditjirri]
MGAIPPPFEHLPFDILHHVLIAIGSVSDLSALIRASSVIYRYYLQRPTFWLYHCLESELGLGIVDACSVHLSNATDFRPSRTKENVLQFLATYDVQRRDHYKARSILLDEDQIIPAAPRQVNLSGTAQHHRNWSNSAGLLSISAILQSVWTLGDRRKLCVNAFIEDKYSQVLDEVTWDFHPDNPKWDAERTDPYTPVGAYNIEWFDNFYRVGMSSLSLTILSSIFEARDHPTLVELVSRYIILSNGDWLFEATDDLVQERRRSHFLSERDQAQDRREAMPFEGDREDLPPLAWVILWKETSSNLYGVHIKESFRKWGYVLWDAGRLISSGAADTLTTEWDRFCTTANGDFEDARDLM